MAMQRSISLVQNFRTRGLNFSTSCFVGNRWRREQELEPGPWTFGPLINLPDYSFVDGRPVPLSARKKLKVQKQKKFCQKIVELTNEIDVGMKRYYEKLEEEKRRKENILQNKLKPKGDALLKKK